MNIVKSSYAAHLVQEMVWSVYEYKFSHMCKKEKRHIGLGFKDLRKIGGLTDRFYFKAGFLYER